VSPRSRKDGKRKLRFLNEGIGGHFYACCEATKEMCPRDQGKVREEL